MMSAILRHVLESQAAMPFDSLAAFRVAAKAAAAPFEHTVDRAIAAGCAADRVGYAFGGGYQAALVCLVPSLASASGACLAATEKGGAHPGAIETRLVQSASGAWTLSGRKSWVTLADPESMLLVVASLGLGSSGKNRLRVVRLPASRRGVKVHVKTTTPSFAVEIAHAEVELDGVVVEGGEILEGDGYDRYLKPFRTLEDIHVLAAILGYVTVTARAFDWPDGIVDQLAAHLVTLRALGAEEPSRAEVHIALAGTFAAARETLERALPFWQRAGADVAARWARDRLLLDVAEGARKKRLEAAWRTVRAEHVDDGG